MLAAMRTLLAVPLAATALGCSSSSSQAAAPDAAADVAGDAGSTGLGGYDPNPFGGSRPVKLYVPPGYSPSTPAPLVILLHGYSASGAEEDLYLDLHATAEADTVLYAHPDGTIDSAGNRFWNATDACCNFDGSSVDDSTYLASLVTEIESRYSVDRKRVYFMGHSNGAFMSYRMACDHADVVAAIVSLAGAMWLDTSKCKPSAPVSVLEVHGTSDTEVLYNGGTTASDAGPGNGAYPGAATTVGDWVTYDGCSTPGNTSLPNVDIVSSMSTTVTQYKAGCRAGTEVDLWTIQGGPHIPGFNPSFGPDAFQFLLSHPKP